MHARHTIARLDAWLLEEMPEIRNLSGVIVRNFLDLGMLIHVGGVNLGLITYSGAYFPYYLEEIVNLRVGRRRMGRTS